MNDLQGGNCVSCHTLPGQAGALSTFAPPLAGVASRWSPAQLRQWVMDARVLRPDTLMPPFGTLDGVNHPQPARPVLTVDQVEAVVAALLSLQAPAR